MSQNFANFYNELLSLAQKHADNGVSLQEIYGACGAAQNHVGFMLHEHYKKQATVKEWEETQKKYEPQTPDLPLVETTEDN